MLWRIYVEANVIDGVGQGAYTTRMLLDIGTMTYTRLDRVSRQDQAPFTTKTDTMRVLDFEATDAADTAALLPQVHAAQTPRELFQLVLREKRNYAVHMTITFQCD